MMNRAAKGKHGRGPGGEGEGAQQEHENPPLRGGAKRGRRYAPLN
jgi:hypothetical protein